MSQRRTTKRGPSKGLIILAIVILAVMLVETAIVVATFVSPEASKTVSDKIAAAQRAVEGTDESPGLKERGAKAADAFLEDQVKPLWQAPQPPPTEDTFLKCASCHPGYEQQERFPNGIYIDHVQHAQEGVGCATCHTMVQHPNPAPPSEDVCQKCHDEVTQKNKCEMCHSPGSVPHFYLKGYPRTQAPICSTCHPNRDFRISPPERLVRAGPFLGDPSNKCLQCHEEKHSTDYVTPACQDCHGVNHPSDWRSTHGSQVAYVGLGKCQNCHPVSGWCAVLCHPLSAPTTKLPMPTEVPT